MKPVFNMEPKYTATMLTREEWTRGPGAPPAVKGFVWITGGSRTVEGTEAGAYGQSADRRLSGSASLLENMPQSFRLRYMPY